MSRLIGNSALPGGGRLLQVGDCGLVDGIRPGHWFRLGLAGRRHALAVLDSSPREQWLAFQLPAALAAGCAALPYGTPCDLDGPFGEPIAFTGAGRLIIAADGAGLPALLFAGRATEEPIHLALLALEAEAPVRLCPSRFIVHGMPNAAIAGIAPLEEAGIASRVAHPESRPGCFQGTGPELLAAYLAGKEARWRWEVTIHVLARETALEAYRTRLRASAGRLRLTGLPAPAMPGRA